MVYVHVKPVEIYAKTSTQLPTYFH